MASSFSEQAKDDIKRIKCEKTQGFQLLQYKISWQSPAEYI